MFETVLEGGNISLTPHKVGRDLKEKEMPQNRIMTPEQRLAVLGRVKPQGGFIEPPQKNPFSQTPIPWEEQLGDLQEWRDHKGAGRKILPALADGVKTQSVMNSILARLRKLYPEESWSCYVNGSSVYLKFNGPRRHNRTSGAGTNERSGEDDLFSQTG